jgi:sulfatase maturation enzyme AslB (radical SAM superfamily)
MSGELAPLRRFDYQGTPIEFEPGSLRFRPLDHENPALEQRFAEAQRTPAARRAPFKGGINFATLNVAHDCNMACPYCFAKQGLYGGRVRQLMDEDTARRSIDWLFERAGDKPEVYLRFLGGEPLMNVPVIEASAAYAEELGRRTGKQVFLSLNTNGTIFTRRIDELLRRHRITVSISMDGTREAHDVYRIFRNGTGTYDRVVRNLERFLACDPNTMINATLTTHNVDVDASAALFRAEGINLVRFALVGTAIDGIAVAQEERLERLLGSYDRLAERYRRELLSGDVWYLADFYKYLGGFRDLEKRYSRCGAGTTYVNIDVEGGVNLCHRFTTDATQKVGDVDGGDPLVPLAIHRRDQLGATSATSPSGAGVSKLTGQPGVRAGERPRHRTPLHLHRQLDGTPFFEQDSSTAGVADANVCATCDIRYLCGGSCFHDGEIHFGDLFGGPDGFKCAVDRHLAKIAMWLLDGVYAADPAILDRLDALHLRSQQHHAA